MSKLNFSIALKMTTAQFRKGADVVKRSLKSMQYQVLGMASALGVGAVGLKGLVSELVKTARETNRARVALKNISGDAAGFSNNMNFLLRTSRKWGQELNGMTSEFAKFSAAASSAGIPIQEQQYIFDTFTRSITAFGMSSEEAHLSYLALSQMMSKGKVSSEELRRQLGEKMPIAMEAMARAAGVTIQELDKLLSGGKLISKDIMTPFMKEMEKMLPDVDVDNIETSVNRLRNTFIQLTEDLKVGDIYKKLVDGANKMLANVTKSFARVATTIVSSIAGSKIVRAFMQLRITSAETNAKILAEKQRTEQQMEIATAKRVAAEKRYNEMSALYSKVSVDQQLAYYTRMKTAESSMNKARLTEKAALVAMEKAHATKSISLWTVAWRNIKTAAVSAFATIKAMMSSIVPMAIIGVITNFVMRLREVRKEAEEIKNLFSEYQKEAKNIGSSKELTMLEASLSVLNDKNSTQEEINTAQATLNSMLGTEITNQEKLNDKVRERIALLKASAEAEFYTNKSIEATDERDALLSKYGGDAGLHGRLNTRSTWSALKKDVFGIESQIDLDAARITELNKIISHANERIEDAIKSGVIKQTDYDSTTTTPTGVSAGTAKETPLEKAEAKYADELEKLRNQKAIGAIKEQDYNKAIDDLNKATYEEIAGILGVNADRNETFKLAKEGVENQLSVENKLLDISDDYAETLKALDSKKQLGLISEDSYNDALIDLINSTSDKVASLEDVGDAEREYIAELKKIKDNLIDQPTLGARDTTFDYKKSEADKLKEDIALQEKYVSDLTANMNKARDYGVEAIKQIKEEEDKLTSLGDALRIAELKEDIQSLNKELFSASVDGLTGFANQIDRIARSWARIADTDMSGFERIVAIMKAMGDTIKGMVSAWESYNAIRQLVTDTSLASGSLETAKKIADDGAVATSAAAKSTAVVAGLKAEEAAATGVMAAASTAAYAAMPFVGVGLATAQIGAMKSLIASTKALGAIPGFAKGGIVGGASKSGDRNIIRANSGEMVLTTPQQSKLWQAISTGNYGKDGQKGSGEFVIRGRDLVAIINQEGKLKSRI